MSWFKQTVRTKIEHRPPEQVWRQVDDEIMEQVWALVRSPACERIEGQVQSQVERQAGETR